MRIRGDIAQKVLNAAQISQIIWQRQRDLASQPLRVGLIGAQGLGNLGDDALFEAATRLLAGRQVVDYQWGARETRLRSLGLSGPRFFEAVILGGGTLINDFSFNTCKQALRSGVPLWSLGTGAGSSGFLQPPQVELKAWAPLLRDFAALGVRGPCSQRALQAIGIENSQVIGDLALSLMPDEENLETGAPQTGAPQTGAPQTGAPQTGAPQTGAPQTGVPQTGVPRVLFNFFCAHQSVPHGEYAALRELDELLPRLHRQGLEIVPVALNPEDVEATRAALERAGLGHLRVEVPSSAAAFFELAAPCRFAIAVRLHAAVLASCVGVPPLLLGYREKCLDFMESMELQGWHLDLETVKNGEITARALELQAAAPALRQPILASARRYREITRSYVAQRLATMGFRS